MATLNESTLMTEMVNKTDQELTKELNKAKVPIRQAKKLVQILSKNRMKMKYKEQE